MPSRSCTRKRVKRNDFWTRCCWLCRKAEGTASMPGRNLNHTERRLLERWNAGFGPSLRSIEVAGGPSLCGLTEVTVDFHYPLVVLAGKNGSGKSTLLACTACAYHNTGPYKLWSLGGKYFRFT